MYVVRSGASWEALAVKLPLKYLDLSKYNETGKSEIEVIISEAEHAANVLPWFALAKELGIVVKYVELNDKNEEKAYTFADLDGYFLMENVPYGTYRLVVSKDEVSLHVLPDIKIEDFELYLGNINITGSSVSENAVDW